MSVTRRQALQSLGFGGLAWLSPTAGLSAAGPRKKLPVAAVVTTYYKNSHADVILGKILEGWRQQGGPGPDLELVSLYTDQLHKADLSRGLAEKYGFHIAQTIDEAVTLGQDKLPVAGVLSVGEHGDYPRSENGQRQYPRRRFLDEIVAAMQRCGEYVPIFSDKHLSWNWRDAKHMVDLTRQHEIPFMAGSSLPVCWRYPAQELPLGSDIKDAMLVGYGDLEAYGFHGLEALQCVLERRRGGETGVAAVTALSGDQIWQAEKENLWDRRLLQSAMATFDGSSERLEERLNRKKSVFYMIEYRDGLRATMAMLNGVSNQYALACHLRDQALPFACWFRLEEKHPFGHFEHLLRGVEHMIHTHHAAYPVERTLLTTGVLHKAMNSMHQGGARLETPELNFCYPAAKWGFANLSEENFPHRTPR